MSKQRTNKSRGGQSPKKSDLAPKAKRSAPKVPRVAEDEEEFRIDDEVPQTQTAAAPEIAEDRPSHEEEVSESATATAPSSDVEFEPTPEPEPEPVREVPRSEKAAEIEPAQTSDGENEEPSDFDRAPSSGRKPSAQRSAAEQATEKAKQPKSLPDKIKFWAAVAVLPIVLLVTFGILLSRKPTADVVELKLKPSLPITGSLVKIASVESGWRTKRDGDRVSAEEEPLTRKTIFPDKLPQLKLRVEPSAKNSFLRILFLRGDGKIAGDPRVIKIVDGKLQSTGRGEEVVSDSECVLVASTGLPGQAHLIDYFSGNQPRWSVEISESSDYQSRGEGWKTLDTFAIANQEL